MLLPEKPPQDTLSPQCCSSYISDFQTARCLSEQKEPTIRTEADWQDQRLWQETGDTGKHMLMWTRYYQDIVLLSTEVAAFIQSWICQSVILDCSQKANNLYLTLRETLWISPDFAWICLFVSLQFLSYFNAVSLIFIFSSNIPNSKNNVCIFFPNI